MDRAIFVIKATQGPTLVARKERLLAHQIWVQYIIVFLRTRDMTAVVESLTFAESEASNLLSRCGYPGDATSVVRGSALKALGGYRQWKAKIIELTCFQDNYTSESESAV